MQTLRSSKLALLAAAFILVLLTMFVTIGRAAENGSAPLGTPDNKPFDPMKDPNFEVPYQGDITLPQAEQ